MRDLETRLATAEARLAGLPRPSATPNDPAYVNVPLRARPSIERDIDRGLAITLAEDDVKSLKSRIAYREASAPIPFTDEGLKAALVVRTLLGWHKVIKVNAKSVTVATAYSWTDRYTLDKILEVR